MSHSPVLKLVAGAGVALTPTNGQGIVTIDLSGGTVPTLTPGQLLYGSALGTIAQSTGMSWSDANERLTITKAGVVAALPLELVNTNAGATSVGMRFITLGSVRGTISFGTSLVSIGIGSGGATQLQVASATKNLLFGFWQDGDIGLADTAHSLVTSTTTGFVWLPNMAGPPTGVPAHLADLSHSTPIVIDTTGTGTLYGYVGGAWHALSGGGSGADALGHYLVTTATNAPVNAVDLGSMTQGVLQQTVSGAVATVAPFNLASGRVPFGNATGGLDSDSAFNYSGIGGALNVGRVNTPLLFSPASLQVDVAVSNSILFSIGGTIKGGMNLSGLPFYTALVGPGLVSVTSGGLMGVDTTAYISGSMTTTAVPYATGTSTVHTDSAFWYDAGTQVLTVPELDTATVANASNLRLTSTLGNVTVDSQGADVTVQANSGSSGPALVLTAAGATRLSALTSNGFVKTTGGTGTLTVDTSAYLLVSTASATYETIAHAAVTYETISHAAATYQPILSATAGRVLFAGGGSTISSDVTFAWDNPNGLLTITNGNNITTPGNWAGVWIKDVTAFGNAALRVDSQIRCDAYAPMTGLPTAFYSGNSASVTFGAEVFRIDDGVIWSQDTSANMNIRVSGGAIELGTGGVVANGSVATVLGSLGPAGASTAVRKWLPITVSGTTYYAPLF